MKENRINMKKHYPPDVERLLTGDSTAVCIYFIMTIASWFYLHSVYTVLVGMFCVFVILIMRIRLLRRVKKYGYEWKRYRVISYTYLRRWNRKPTGFVALSSNDGEPIRRYHFALADRMKTPELDAYVDVCIPGDARISEIGRNFYVSSHYGISQNGHPL